MDTIKPPNLITSVIPEEYKLADSVYEMADELKRYKREIRGNGYELYKHVIYVCVLGNKINLVEHWKREITNFVTPVFDTRLKSKSRKIDRGKYVRSEMMSHWMGANFEDYAVDDFESALDDELSKGHRMLADESRKSNWKQIRHQYEIIKDVREHLEGVPEQCLEMIRKFYDGLVHTASMYGKVSNDEINIMFHQVLDELQPVIK